MNDLTQVMNMVVPLPKYKHVDKATKDRTTKSGKFVPAKPRKEFQRLALLNTIPQWFRWQKTAIKNEYKQLLVDFYLPEATEQYRSGEITFIIQRHTKARIDSDSIALAVKWFCDTLVESGWLSDDDQIIHHLHPAEYAPGTAETQMRVIVSLRH